MQIPHTLTQNFGFPGIDKKQHQWFGKCADKRGQHHAEGSRNQDSAFQTRAYAVVLLCTVVLRNKGGEGVAEILHRHIGKGIDFYGSSKGCHHNGAKAVHKPLYHKNTEIHHRLLDTGQRGIGEYFPDPLCA